MKIEEQKLNNPQKQQLNIPAVSGWRLIYAIFSNFQKNSEKNSDFFQNKSKNLVSI